MKFLIKFLPIILMCVLLIPWHVFTLFYASICNAVFPLETFTPIDIIKYNFMAFIAIGTIFLLTFTGWDRFIPLFKMPGEPDIHLKDSEEREQAA